MEMEKKYLVAGGLILLALMALSGLAVISGGAQARGEYDTFASCLAEKGATFYGAFWCPNCAAQKELFGASAKKLPYVECSPPNRRGQYAVCRDAGIARYPTWEFADGSREEGVLPLEVLAEKTGCPLQKDTQEEAPRA